jgi:hypothetical protein
MNMTSVFTIASLSAILLFLASTAHGQPVTDSTAHRDSVSRSSHTIVDEDGDGIDDRRDQGAKVRRRARFIDEDGDGICDGRESGLGFKGGTKEGLQRRRGGGK